jgi:hypothetical protein
MRARRVVASLVTLGLLAGAPTALAGTVTHGTFTAAPGEKNDVRFDAYPPPPVATVVDLGAPLVVGPGCSEGTPVTCDALYNVALYLGDRADSGSASAVISSIVYGEQGDDVIWADAEEPRGYGGPGDDKISLNGNGVSGYGGRGNDYIDGPTQGAVGTRFWGEEGDDTLVAMRGAGRCSLDGGPGGDRLLSFSCTQRGGPAAT